MRWPLMGHGLVGLSGTRSQWVANQPPLPLLALLAHYRLELVHLNLTPVLVCSSLFHAAIHIPLNESTHPHHVWPARTVEIT